MSLRTSPQTGVVAQLSATKERYRCGIPLAGAIRPPFGTTLDDRNCRGKRIATSLRSSQ